jgi:hypothetical protein
MVKYLGYTGRILVKQQQTTHNFMVCIMLDLGMFYYCSTNITWFIHSP